MEPPPPCMANFLPYELFFFEGIPKLYELYNSEQYLCISVVDEVNLDIYPLTDCEDARSPEPELHPTIHNIVSKVQHISTSKHYFNSIKISIFFKCVPMTLEFLKQFDHDQLVPRKQYYFLEKFH